jgi:medium-chain acyl-[acyl-carrier-protein] hydrolase
LATFGASDASSRSDTIAATALWLPLFRHSGQGRVRLFCFPYAGGSISIYAGWPRMLPDVEVRPVQLPGRGARLRDIPIARIEALIETAAPVFEAMLDRPYALFGHSMGALIAFEMARAFRQRGWRMPTRLYVSGRRAPHLPGDDLVDAAAPDAQFIDDVRALAGTPPQVLGSAELMNLVLPALRADFQLVGSYRYLPGEALACPITVLGGCDDRESSPGYLEGWAQHTLGPTEVIMYDGGHFFLQTSESAVLDLVRTSLAAAPETPAAAG